MENYKITIIVCLLSLFNLNLFSQSTTYPFTVEIKGEGKQAIIFIPGFASSGDVWDETVSKFENKHTCYTLTMAGFAGVEPQKNPSFKQWENAIANYIKDHKITKPILVGHSMGGGLAFAIASDYPDLIDKIVIVDALPCLSALMNPSFQSKEQNDCSDAIKQITSMSDEAFYKMQKMTMANLLATESMQETVIGWSVKSDKITFAKMYCDFLNTDLRERIKTIKCPSLIMLEANFLNLGPAIAAQYKNLETAELKYANKGLHFIMYDDKEWYFKQLTNFITID